MTIQSTLHSSFQTIHGGAGRDFNSDAMLAMKTELEAAALTVPGTLNERWIAWLQYRLSSTETNINGLFALFRATYPDGVVPAATTDPLGAPDMEASINDGLIYFVGSHPEGADELGMELVNELAVTAFGSATFDGDHPSEAGWKCLETVDVGTDGAWTTRPAAIEALTDDYTIWADIDYDAVDTSAHIISLPWAAAATWASPWKVMMFGRNTTNADLRHQHTPAGSLLSADQTGLADGFPTSAGRRQQAVTRADTAFRFFLNGALQGGEITGNGDPPNWAGSDSDRVVIFNRKDNSPDDNIQGRLLQLRIWNRTLTDQEIADLTTDPLLGIFT